MAARPGQCDFSVSVQLLFVSAVPSSSVPGATKSVMVLSYLHLKKLYNHLKHQLQNGTLRLGEASRQYSPDDATWRDERTCECGYRMIFEDIWLVELSLFKNAFAVTYINSVL